MKFLWMVFIVCSTVSFARAENGGVVLAGAEYSSSNAYSQVGSVIPMEGSTLKQGANFSMFASWLNYSYTTTQNNQLLTVRAQVPGVRAGLGYQWLMGDVELGLSASVGYQNTHQTPYIPATGKQGGAVVLLPQVQLKYRFTPQTDADLMANYSAGQSAYWSHLRLGYQPQWDWRFGPELGLQGGQNYRIGKVGAFVAKSVHGGMLLELNGGIQANNSLPREYYLGLAISKSI